MKDVGHWIDGRLVEGRSGRYGDIFKTHLLGAAVRRPSVMALLYAFFLESIAGNLPGHFKRLSISYYLRCLMFEGAHEHGIRPERPQVFLPVSGTTAAWMLAAITLGCLLAGMWIFAKKEYVE